MDVLRMASLYDTEYLGPGVLSDAAAGGMNRDAYKGLLHFCESE